MNHLLEFAMAGYTGVDFSTLDACPTSDCHMAWLVGAALAARRMDSPQNVRMSRGYRMWANGILWQINYSQAAPSVWMV